MLILGWDFGVSQFAVPSFPKEQECASVNLLLPPQKKTCLFKEF